MKLAIFAVIFFFVLGLLLLMPTITISSSAVISSSAYGGKRTEIYYCHPYCSSERGSNENCNRIIRRWIPKGQDIGQYSEGYIQKVQDWINYYPRRLHGHFSAAAWADVWLSA